MDEWIGEMELLMYLVVRRCAADSGRPATARTAQPSIYAESSCCRCAPPLDATFICFCLRCPFFACMISSRACRFVWVVVLSSFLPSYTALHSPLKWGKRRGGGMSGPTPEFKKQSHRGMQIHISAEKIFVRQSRTYARHFRWPLTLFFFFSSSLPDTT
jgi:hypothetical protein